MVGSGFILERVVWGYLLCSGVDLGCISVVMWPGGPVTGFGLVFGPSMVVSVLVGSKVRVGRCCALVLVVHGCAFGVVRLQYLFGTGFCFAWVTSVIVV